MRSPGLKNKVLKLSASKISLSTNETFPMNILGIETSCDETAAAVVSDGVKVHSNIIATSLKDHQRFGGIIPEIASRRQIEFIYWVVGEALSQANKSLKDIDTIAVT